MTVRWKTNPFYLLRASGPIKGSTFSFLWMQCCCCEKVILYVNFHCFGLGCEVFIPSIIWMATCVAVSFAKSWSTSTNQNLTAAAHALKSILHQILFKSLFKISM